MEDENIDNKQITQDNLKRVNDLVEKIQNMTAEEFRAMLDSMAKFHNYSFSNRLILWGAGASQVAGFQKWKSFGRSVKKGGKAIWILAPNGEFRVVKKKLDSEGKETDEEYFIKRFKSVPVFDIKDTEGKDIEKNFTIRSNIDFEVMKGVATNLGFGVMHQPMEVSIGGFIRAANSIVLNSNLNSIENTGTLIHEVCHGLLGHTDLGVNDTAPIRDRELTEQEAEITTYLVCQAIGIERKSEFYLKSWETSKEIMKSFNRIDNAMQSIIQEISKK